MTNPKNPSAFSATPSVDLDPSDWNAFRGEAHGILDDILNYIQDIRHRPVWQPLSSEVRLKFRQPLPSEGTTISAIHDDLMKYVLPFSTGNVHPGFMGWLHGGGNTAGLIAEVVSAGLNANLGGRSHAPIEVERQVVDWMRQLFGFPEDSSGLLVTGTSAANLIAVLLARFQRLGPSVRKVGLAAFKDRLVAYASEEAHVSVAKAMEHSGLGSDALRLIPAKDHKIDIDEVEKAIKADRLAGAVPFLVIGTAGTTDIGAIDDLERLSILCRKEGLWFHVDGALAALGMMSPMIAPDLAGIESADSLAFDFHKWCQVPYDAGFVLVRDGALHLNAFSTSPAYLAREERGLSGGSPWFCDLGLDLSRGFRALKVWYTLRHHGTRALGESISRCCVLARYLKALVEATPELEAMAPVQLNIVCFRYKSKNPDELNREVLIRLQESGTSAPSATRIAGKFAIRAAIVNHRTREEDIERLIAETVRIGHLLSDLYADG